MTKAELKERFTAILALDSHPGHIAAGFAVGVFISSTPFSACIPSSLLLLPLFSG